MEESVSKWGHTKSEAGKLSTRKRTTLRRVRKFEIKNNQNMFIIEEFCLICQRLFWLHDSWNLSAKLHFLNIQVVNENWRKFWTIFACEQGFNVMMITFIKLRMEVFIKPYFCCVIVPNSKATTLSARNITVWGNSGFSPIQLSKTHVTSGQTGKKWNIATCLTNVNYTGVDYCG